MSRVRSKRKRKRIAIENKRRIVAEVLFNFIKDNPDTKVYFNNYKIRV